MSEKLEVFNLKGKSLGFEDRDKFYKELGKAVKNNEVLTKKIKSIRVILMNSQGRIYLQKRSKLKEVNPGIYDKTIGGHVPAGHSWNMTLIRECAEELGFPASVVPDSEFEKTVKIIDLKIVGIFRQVDFIENFESVNINKHGKEIKQPWITTIFIGYYDGAIRFADGESTGIEVFSLDELREEIRTTPDKFTNDAKIMIEKYGKFLKPIENK